MGCLLRGLVTFLHATHVKLQVENFALQKHNWDYILLQPVIDEMLEISFRIHLAENEKCTLKALKLSV